MEFPVTDVPNSLIAVLWQDNDLTFGAEPKIRNYLYYFYDEDSRELIFEWYEVVSPSTGRAYTYEAILNIGGQDMLLENAEGFPLFSHHFIHFLYSDSDEWYADNGETGIEDYTGSHGIYYMGTYMNGLVTRMGYKKIFRHDVGVSWVELDPPLPEGGQYEPGTEITITATVINYGTEIETGVPVACEIMDQSDEVDTMVYINHEYVAKVSPWPGDSTWPCSTHVSFPWPFNPSQSAPMDRWIIEVRTEMVDDEYPDNDLYRITSTGIEEEHRTQDFTLDVLPIFDGYTHIHFTLPRAGNVILSAYDVNGRRVDEIASGWFDAGEHAVDWDNPSLPRGVYFIKLETGGFSTSRKFIVVD